MKRASQRLFTALGVAWLVFAYVALLGIVLALPAWMLYSLVAPLFGPDPAGEYLRFARAIGTWLLFFGSLGVSFLIVVQMARRFRLVRTAIKTIGAVFLGLLVLVSLARCLTEGPACGPGRYIDCQ